ncbi:MAG: hypothetical protein Q9227_005014 [Pyrenula ochraceoflavens]
MIFTALKDSEPQIRLLKLEPAQHESDDIYCKLATAAFDRGKRLEYEALSYVWGDTADPRRISVNGKPIFVTQNLDLALRRLRNAHTARTLWIDAICIDQSNNTEKVHQINQMRDIFASASRVLVWLGESEKDIDLAFMVMRTMSSQPPKMRDQIKRGLFYYTLVPGLAKLLKKQWWSRVWVLQEFLVASTPPLIGCGRNWTSYEVMGQLFGMLMEDSINGLQAGGPQNFSLDEVNKFLGFQHVCSLERTNIRLEDLLRCASTRTATLPHDQIYALQGLLERRFPVDYDCPISALYQCAMVEALEEAANLELLAYAVNEHNLELPTWCIDFSRNDWYDRPRLSQRFFSRKPSQGPNTALIKHDLDHGVLEVRGIKFGQVARVQNLGDKNRANLSRAKGMSEAISNITTWARAAPLRQDIDAMLVNCDIWKLLFMEEPFEIAKALMKKASEDLWGRKWTRTDFPHSDGSLAWSAERNSGRAASVRSTNLVPDDEKFSMIAALDRLSRFLGQEETLVVNTNDGDVALARGQIEIGDVLCAFPGSEHIFSLRPVGGAYQLIAISEILGHQIDLKHGSGEAGSSPLWERHFNQDGKTMETFRLV